MCPYHYDLKYNKRLTEILKYDANSPLINGHALHKGIETTIEEGLAEFYNAFPVVTDDIVNEAIKLEILIPMVKDYLNGLFKDCEFIHEYKIDNDTFVGYVDLIAKKSDGTCAIVDFKYTNHQDSYKKSEQLHLYKKHLNQDGFNVTHLYYLFIPKFTSKSFSHEDLHQFRTRIRNEVLGSKLTLLGLDFDPIKVARFNTLVKKIATRKDFSERSPHDNCFSCMPKFRPNYLEALENDKGEIIMLLPKNERREKKIDTKPDFWIYGDSYVGKSTFVDQMSNVLFLNTDGNTDNTTAPVLSLKDEVITEGRRTRRTLAWQLFIDTIDELEANAHKYDYETVALDLVEDIYEQCRYYVFDKNNWEHESDGGYGKGWSKVTTEFQNAMKRLKALGYQIVYISKEEAREVTLTGGVTRTTFKPNINDRVANFLTGTVDLTMRVYIDSKDNRFLQLGKKRSVFGGGRFDFKEDIIPLNYSEFIEEIKEAQDGRVSKSSEEKPKKSRKKRPNELEDSVFERTTYYYHPESDSYVKFKKGDEIPSDFDGSNEITKEEYEGGLAEQEEVPEEKPKRQRRKRTKEPEELADDETPPGEESSDEDKEQSNEDLSGMTLKELKSLAEDYGVDTDEVKGKRNLIKAIEEANAPDDEEEVPEEKPKRQRRRRSSN